MADQISKLHTELTVGSAGFAAEMRSAKAHVGGLGEEFHKVGNSLDRLGNRLDRQDISQGFHNISEAIGKASGAGATFGTFVGQLGLGFATGGIAGAAFGGAINLINIGLEKFNEHAEEAKKKTSELREEWNKITRERNERQDRLGPGALTGDLAAGLAEVEKGIAGRKGKGKMVWSREAGGWVEQDEIAASLRLEADSLRDRLETAREADAREADARARLSYGSSRGLLDDIRAPFAGDSARVLPPEFIGDVGVRNPIEEANARMKKLMDDAYGRSMFLSRQEDQREEERRAKAANAVSAILNPAILKGSQADLELRARTDQDALDAAERTANATEEMARKMGDGDETGTWN